MVTRGNLASTRYYKKNREMILQKRRDWYNTHKDIQRQRVKDQNQKRSNKKKEGKEEIQEMMNLITNSQNE